jgi:hypothetical protein
MGHASGNDLTNRFSRVLRDSTILADISDRDWNRRASLLDTNVSCPMKRYGGRLIALTIEDFI